MLDESWEVHRRGDHILSVLGCAWRVPGLGLECRWQSCASCKLLCLSRSSLRERFVDVVVGSIDSGRLWDIVEPSDSVCSVES